jgi:C4-dicarboxylate-specific signal transduction histidine kinase
VFAFCVGLARATRWQALPRFALIAFSAAGYSLCNLVQWNVDSPALAAMISCGSICMAGLHSCAWLLYQASLAGRRLRGWERGVVGMGAVLMGLACIPGALVTRDLVAREVAWPGVRYVDTQPTTLGAFGFVYFIATVLLVLGRFVQSTRRREQDARLHASAIAVVTVCGVNDSLAAALLIDTPYLLDLAFMCAVVTVAVSMVRRMARTSHELRTLSSSLEAQIEERTDALARSQDQLHHAEKLAAIGQLAAGVAHEINNPAAVALTNITYLRDALLHGAPPPDAIECLDDSREGLERVASVVRQLADAGRAARTPEGREQRVSVREAAEEGVMTSRRDCLGLQVTVDVPAPLEALGEPALVSQVVAILLKNAAHSIRSVRATGKVLIRGRATPAGVEVELQDDGPGPPTPLEASDVTQLFNWQPGGKKPGLGLSVALGLARAMGGDLRGAGGPDGMRMVLTLRRAPEIAGRGTRDILVAVG